MSCAKSRGSLPSDLGKQRGWVPTRDTKSRSHQCERPPQQTELSYGALVVSSQDTGQRRRGRLASFVLLSTMVGLGRLRVNRWGLQSARSRSRSHPTNQPTNISITQCMAMLHQPLRWQGPLAEPRSLVLPTAYPSRPCTCGLPPREGCSAGPSVRHGAAAVHHRLTAAAHHLLHVRHHHTAEKSTERVHHASLRLV